MLKQAFKKPHIFASVFVTYLVLNFFISGFYKTITLLYYYSDTVNWTKIIVSLIFTLAIAFLVSLNFTLVYIKYKQKRDCKRQGTLATIGTIGGLATGVCPLCVSGLFPLILSFVGVSFSFATLPFSGMEIQIGVIILLLISLFYLKK